MKLVFQYPETLEGAVPEGVIDLEYGHHKDFTLECVDTEGNGIDVEALGMAQWRLAAVSAVEDGVDLAEWNVASPVGNVFGISIGVYSPRLFEYLAGRTDYAVVLQLRGYEVADDDGAPQKEIVFEAVLSCNGNTRCPTDIHQVLLEELAYTVQHADADAARAVAAAAAAERIQRNVESATYNAAANTAALMRQEFSTMSAGASTAADNAQSCMSVVTSAVSTVNQVLSSAGGIANSARIAAEGTDEQVSSAGMGKSAKGWWSAASSQADLASGYASSAARSMESATTLLASVESLASALSSASHP